MWPIIAAAAIALPAGAQADVQPDEAIEQYLEALGLDGLLADHLEARLPGVSGAGRVRLAERLGELYAALLEQSNTDVERRHWRQRALSLLERVPEADSFDLRIDLHRAAYTQAERLAERWRLRIDGDDARSEAASVMAEIAPDLLDIGARAERRIEEVRRQEESAAPSDPGLLAQMGASARRQRSLAMYLAGWSKAYLAELTGATVQAEGAIRAFGALLNAASNGTPDIDRVPPVTLQYEHVARAALGVAHCHALLGNAAEAAAWFDLLETTDQTPAELTDEITARRWIALARARDWTTLRVRVEMRRLGDSIAEGGPLSVPEARLLIVLASENRAARERAQEDQLRIAELAVNDLIIAGAIDALVDLARLYGVQGLLPEGDLQEYVRGVLAYEEARSAHAALDPKLRGLPDDRETARRYARSAEMLERSVTKPLISEDIATLARATMLLGYAQMNSVAADAGEEGIAALEQAAQTLASGSVLFGDAPDGAAALLGAIGSLERAAARASGPADRARIEGARRRFASDFVERFPQHPGVGFALVQLAEGADVSDEEAVELLLNVPSDSAAYEAARVQAADLLYRQFRSRRGAERAWAAQRYVELAEALVREDLARDAGDPAVAVRVVVRGRRVLEALMSGAAVDVPRARRLIEQIERAFASATSISETDAALIRAELTYRRAQLALADNDLERAERLVERLVNASAPAPIADAARRLLFQHAARQWRDASRLSADEMALLDAARSVVSSGLPLIGDERTSDEAARLAVIATTSQAAYDVWRLGERQEGDRARAALLHRELLDARPGEINALRRLADLSEAGGDLHAALQCWRELSVGLPRDSSDWFEARTRVIELLAQLDVERAQDVIAQHALLHPDFGPAPWGERLRALHDRLVPEERR